MSPEIVKELAPNGVLRAAINMSNFLLVTGLDSKGDPTGVSPDMAAELARRLKVELKLLQYKTPAEISDDAGNNLWDIGAEPKRAKGKVAGAAYLKQFIEEAKRSGLVEQFIKKHGMTERLAVAALI